MRFVELDHVLGGLSGWSTHILWTVGIFGYVNFWQYAAISSFFNNPKYSSILSSGLEFILVVYGAKFLPLLSLEMWLSLMCSKKFTRACLLCPG